MPTSESPEEQALAEVAVARRQKQRGQSLVEFGLCSSVLLLLLTGLVDLTRVFYFSSGIQGAANEAARHAVWFDPGSKRNTYLDDADIVSAVNQGLAGTNLPSVSGSQGTCPTPTDGNTQHNPPFANSAYPSPGSVYLYICYTTPAGTTVASEPTPPAAFDGSWHLGQVNVILLYQYKLFTGFLQNVLSAAGGIHVAADAHYTVQGGN
jgi:Flp pilus assembly protein TadG